MFSSICTVCKAVISTKTDQSVNPNFRCKSCNTKMQNNTKDVLYAQKLDEKFGPKVINGWFSNWFPFNFIPFKTFMNDVRCDRCHNRFYAHDIPDNCPKCISIIPCDLICTKCNKQDRMTPASYKKRDNMCIDCYNSLDREFVCEYCKDTFVDSHNSYNKLNASICFKCRETKG
jgi:hypothetical protein